MDSFTHAKTVEMTRGATSFFNRRIFFVFGISELEIFSYFAPRLIHLAICHLGLCYNPQDLA